MKKGITVVILIIVILSTVALNLDKKNEEEVVDSIFEGLEIFSERADVQSRMDLLEKEAFLEEKRKEALDRHEKNMAEIEAALDTVREEISYS